MKKYRVLIDYMYIMAGSLVLAVAINFFLLPCKISTGGVSGLATVLYYMFKIPVSVTTLAVNFALFSVGFKMLNKNQLVKTGAGVVFLSIFLEVSSYFDFYADDIFVSSVFGGLLIGLGVALTVLRGASTGGTDFAAIMLQQKVRHVSIANFMLIIDASVIVFSALAFKDYVVMLYSIISLYIAAKVTDSILVRGYHAKCVYIISKKHSEISEFIKSKMQRGVTGVYAKGLYKLGDGMMLMCVLKSKEVPFLIDGIKEIDADSFTVISDVRGVHGKGFNDY